MSAGADIQRYQRGQCDQAQCMSDPVLQSALYARRGSCPNQMTSRVRWRLSSGVSATRGSVAARQHGTNLAEAGATKGSRRAVRAVSVLGTEDAVAREKAKQFLREAQQEVLNLPPAPVNAPSACQGESLVRRRCHRAGAGQRTGQARRASSGGSSATRRDSSVVTRSKIGALRCF